MGIEPTALCLGSSRSFFRPDRPFRIQLSWPERHQADAHLSQTSEHLPSSRCKKQRGRAFRPAARSLARDGGHDKSYLAPARLSYQSALFYLIRFRAPQLVPRILSGS